MAANVELTIALVVTGEHVYMGGRLATMPADTQFTRLFQYRAHGSRMWTKHDVPWRTVALAKIRAQPDVAPLLAALSEEGDVELAAGRERVVERIPGAGLYGPTSTRHGYVSSIRQIGEHAYVCGDGGQVHRRIGADRWERMDEGLLQTRGASDLLLLSAIDGPAEDDLYVAGEISGSSGRDARLFHWDGARWSPVLLPPVGAINAIHVESEDRIWLAGIRGTLLRGNHRAGFLQLVPYRSSQVFQDVTIYQGTPYLASNYGLFWYDAARSRVVRARPDLARGIEDAHTVNHADGVLWVVGSEDMLRFDGQRWERINHIDNPPLQ